MNENPYTPPNADLHTENQFGEVVLASRWKRLGAALIDGLIQLIIVAPIIFIFFGFDSFADDSSTSFGSSIMMGILGIGLYVAIHGRLLVKYGQTVGKKLLSIRIAQLDGQLPELKGNLVPRYLFYLLSSAVPFIGGLISLINVLFIFGSEKRCIHDLIGKTIVVDI